MTAEPKRSLLTSRLEKLRPTIDPVARRFADAGFRLYLVGGIVRDLQMTGVPDEEPIGATDFDIGFDIDFTTDARPPDIKRLVSPLATAVWTQGERFGTIGASVNGDDLEITTHRAERYDPESRKPVVSFGDELSEDLSRRDFTINAMAIEVPGDELHDPYRGSADLESRVLRTPLSPEVSFTDDPLRMMRAARFVSRFDLSVDPAVMEAATRLANRIEIVSVERVADEVERLLKVADPTAGFDFLRTTGLLSLAVVKMTDEEERLASLLAAAGDAHDEIGVLARRAGLLWSSDVRSVLSRLRYSNDDRKETSSLVLALRDWIDGQHRSLAAGRRLLSRTGSAGAVSALASNLVAHHPDEDVVSSAKELVGVINELRENDDIGPYMSPLSGSQIMETLEIPPGPVVGSAQKYLSGHRLDHGPFDAEEAAEILRRWHQNLK